MNRQNKHLLNTCIKVNDKCILIWVKRIHYVCKFHLENGSIKKLSKKHIEVAKTLPFSLDLFVSDYRAQFSIIFGFKKPIFLKNRAAKTLNDQICKTCASIHNGLKAITKKSWQLKCVSYEIGLKFLYWYNLQ